MLVLFVWWERRDRDPILDLGLFRSGRFSTGIPSRMGSYLVMFGVPLLVPFYFEQGLAYGTVRSAVTDSHAGQLGAASSPWLPTQTGSGLQPR